MNVGFCRLREALEEILHQFDLEIADTFAAIFAFTTQ